MRAVAEGLAVVGLVASLVGLGRHLDRPPPVPVPQPGWTTVRPPGQSLSLAVQGSTLWAGAVDGLYRVEGRTARPVSLPSGPTLEFVRGLLADPDGALWIGHARGLTRWAARGSTTFTTRDGLPDDGVWSLCRDRSGRMWVGTQRGAAVLDGGTWRVVTVEAVSVLLADRRGGVWAGSPEVPVGGLARLGPGEARTFTTDDGLPHPEVVALLEDRRGDVWVGTGFHRRGGAARLSRDAEGRWAVRQVLTRQDGLAGEKVRSLFEDRSGAIWFGSEYDGVARLSRGRLRAFPAEGLGDPEVRAFAQDREGALWMATRNGLTRVDAEALRALDGRVAEVHDP